MKKLDYSVDIEEMCNIEGLLHAYFLDKKNIIIAINKVLEENMNLIGLAKENIIGKRFEEVFTHPLGKNAVEVVIRENSAVIKDEKSKQFYNIWIIKELYKLELLTIKIPIFNNSGKILGAFGLSQYMNKFSIPQAFKLGLSKREIECLFHLIEGRTIKQIASHLNISARTVESYFNNVKNKLDCSTKSELILKALQSDVSIESSLLKNKKILISTALCDSPMKTNGAYSMVI